MNVTTVLGLVATRAGTLSTTLFAAALACLLAACEPMDHALPLVGTIERDRIELIADANEQILEVYVAEGDNVVAGQLLMQLDGAYRSAEFRAAAAQRDAAAQRLAELVRGPRAERIREARARLAGAQKNLVIKTNEHDRTVRLVDRNLSSDSDLDRAQNAQESAAADVEALTAALDELLEGTTAEQLGQAEAQLAEANERVNIAQISVERLELRAPRNGLIDALPYKLGERPPIGATVIVMLAEQLPYARVYVPEPLRAQVVPALAATIVVDGVDGNYAGRVRYVSADSVFTPYFSLTQRDRSRLAYLAEISFTDTSALDLPVGLAVEVDFPSLR
jgi:HlyD family secretion protein